MKTFIAAIFAAVATANNVHDFFAERNYICELCKDAITYTATNKDEALDAMWEQFPALKKRIEAVDAETAKINFQDAEGTCQRLNLCKGANFDVMEMLKAERPLDLDTHINAVNLNKNSTWTAGVNSKFANVSHKEAQAIMGTIVDPDWTIKGVESAHLTNNSVISTPEIFDSRTNWPKCASIIDHIRDQSNCGSCWAHGTTEAYNDRLCIKSDGAFTNQLSVSDTTGCCNFLQCQSMGCNGGQVGTPWKWFTKKGVVTGGDYGDGKLCYDYTMAKCNHHQPQSSFPECDAITQVQPKCDNSCATNTAIDYSKDKHMAASSYGFGRTDTVDKIKTDIFTYGTVTAAFTVYEDFLTYKTGVYQHTTGNALGGHAIKVIGWGNMNGEDYWLCINSWNRTWGDNGTFKIKQGDSGINGQMHAGLA